MAISSDRPAKLRASVDKNDLGYQLLSDSSMTAAQHFGLAWQAKDDMVEQYLSFGLDIVGDSGQDHHILPVPAVFLVGKDGVIRFQYVNPDYRIRLKGGVLLAAAKAELE